MSFDVHSVSFCRPSVSLRLPTLSLSVAFVLLLREGASSGPRSPVFLLRFPPCCRSLLPLPLVSPFGPLAVLSLTPVYLCADSLSRLYLRVSHFFFIIHPCQPLWQVLVRLSQFPSFAFRCRPRRSLRPAFLRPLADGPLIPSSTSNFTTATCLPLSCLKISVSSRRCHPVPAPPSPPLPSHRLHPSISSLNRARPPALSYLASPNSPLVTLLTRAPALARSSPLPSGPFPYPLVGHQRDAFPKRFP